MPLEGGVCHQSRVRDCGVEVFSVSPGSSLDPSLAAPHQNVTSYFSVTHLCDGALQEPETSANSEPKPSPPLSGVLGFSDGGSDCDKVSVLLRVSVSLISCTGVVMMCRSFSLCLRTCLRTRGCS